MSVADRTLVIRRTIHAPVAAVWGAWINENALPQWWGPDGFSCKTKRIDLRQGGEWVFDMIGPDGTVYPNHHRYTAITPMTLIAYDLLMGEDGPLHANATVTMAEDGAKTHVTMSMIMSSQEAHDGAKAFGAEALGLQTLGKLARSIGAQ